MIELKNISIQYGGRQLLEAAELQLKNGELVALIGQNGGGKSSFIKGLTDLNSSFQADMKLGDQSLNEMSRRERSKQISLVLTDAPYPAMMILEEFVAFGRYPFTNWFAKQTEEDLEKVDQAIASCQLDHLRKQLMHTLSDGERQRAMIARSIAQGSDHLILDEPTTHLDGHNTIHILKLLRKQAVEQKKAVLFSTHKIPESIQLADKLWVIWKGELREYTLAEFSKNKELQRSLVGEHFDFDMENGKSSFQINLS